VGLLEDDLRVKHLDSAKEHDEERLLVQMTLKQALVLELDFFGELYRLLDASTVFGGWNEASRKHINDFTLIAQKKPGTLPPKTLAVVLRALVKDVATAQLRMRRNLKASPVKTER